MVRIDVARLPVLADKCAWSFHEYVTPLGTRPGCIDVSNTIRSYYQSPSNNTFAGSRCAARGAISAMVRLPSMASNIFFCCAPIGK